MYILMTPMTAFITPITLQIVLLQAVIWLIAGLAFGGLMKLLIGTKGKIILQEERIDEL